MVPVERIELPTFGLQNRCTTAVLRRLGRHYTDAVHCARRESVRRPPVDFAGLPAGQKARAKPAPFVERTGVLAPVAWHYFGLRARIRN
jgi:hypothetical protein